MQQRLWFRSDQRSIGWSWSGRYLTPWLLTAFLFGATVSALTAQSLPQYSSAQRERIESLRQSFQNTRNENYARAVRIAKLLGQPLSAAGKGRVIELQGVDEAGNLIYVGSTSTTRAGNTTRTSSLYTGGSLGLSLSGSSASVQNRLGLWEVQGLPRATHVELAGRINQIDVGGTTSPDGLLHSTHVAGIMIAQGVNPLVRGMAYGAKIQSYNQTNDISEQTSASSNLLLSNHSYGTISGWYYNDSRTTTVKWEWRGDTTLSATDDYKYGQYSSDAQSWDKIAIAAPNYLIVAAAANDHLQDRPADGDQYYLVNNGNALSRAVRNYQTGYDQIPTRSNAKNILTVAAVGAISNGYNLPTDVQLAYFSSWGPSDDGRIKPDISGVGLNVLSSVADTDTSYAIEQGTSMAAPNVTGSLLLLQEYYAQLNPGKFLRSSTLRGLVLHTAEEAGDAAGPDYRFGWGLLNTEKAARVIGNTDKTNVLSELSLAQGATYSLSVVASGKGPLVATICWTDPEGAVVTPTRDNVNDRTPKLVNDLDIRVTDGKTVSLPWVLDPANPATAATRGDNIRDNIEQILIANAVPGQSYTITVNHKGTLRNSNQDYALIVSGAGGAAYCASAPTSTADTKISRVQFGSINQVGADGCTAYNDFTKTTTTVQAGQVIPITVSLGSCGAAKNAVVKVYIDYNQNGTLDDAGETVAMSGILANSAQYSTTIAIPTTVQNTQVLRMRIVAVETSDAGTVNPCGSYGNGETQDYVLNVVQTSNDVGAASLVTPQTTFCGQSSAETAVSVRVRNYGASSQTNVPVTVQILNSSSVVVTTLTGTVPSLSAFGDALITLKIPTSVSLVPSQTYRFAISTSLSSDQNGGNNAVIETRTTAALPGPGIFSALTCGQSTGVSLRNTGDGVASWYDAPTGGNLLAVGNAAVTSVLPASNVYYVAQNDFSGRFGPATKGELGSGSYGGGYTTQPLLSAKVPLVLATARLYIGTPGRLTFSIRRLDETVVSTVTLDVKTTRTLPTSATSTNGLLDDPNDPGAEYPLNLTIPAAGEYKLAIAYEDGVSIFRNTTAIAGSTITTSTFPVSLSNILTSKGSLFANTTTNKTDTIAYAWYYLYNIQVRPLGCSNGQRVLVTVATGTPPTATVTASGSTTICQGSNVTLRASTGTGYSYQWYRDGQPISGATSSTIAAATSGSYVVQIANSCLPVSSSAIPVSVRSNQTPVITANGFVLTSTATTNIQWLLNGVAIAGATGTSYTVVQSGRYSVKGSVSGCGDAISDEVFLTILATEPDPQDNSLTVYPIPATHQVTIVVAATALNVPSLRLTDLRGITIRSATLQRDGKNYSAVMDVSDLPGGTFFVVVTDERTQTIRVKRIRKQ